MMSSYIPILLIYLNLSTYTPINACESLDSSCSVDEISNEEWFFVGNNLKYNSNYFIHPLGLTQWGVVDCMNGYELSGFDKQGKSKKLFLSFHSSTLVQGWFQKLESKVETKNLVFEMTKSGAVLIRGVSNCLSENTNFTLGRVKARVSFNKKSIGLLKEQITLNFENCYLNKHGEIDEKNSRVIEFSKEKICN